MVSVKYRGKIYNFAITVSRPQYHQPDQNTFPTKLTVRIFMNISYSVCFHATLLACFVGSASEKIDAMIGKWVAARSALWEVHLAASHSHVQASRDSYL